MYWYPRKKKIRRRRTTVTKHYLTHKEIARNIITGRLQHWNNHYNFTYNRIGIRNQKTCWGSCTDKGNLNFNYKLIFLPNHLLDYVLVHELCHLQELNHGQSFWQLVEMTLPNYKEHIVELRSIEKIGWVNYLKQSTRLAQPSISLDNVSAQ
jgi:predicted metal-dependent hydrolase